MEAIILAGGLGTRLSSRLMNLPKPMAPISGRPFLQILLDQLIAAGASRVIVSVGHLREVIIDAFHEGYCGLPLTYVVEESPLGTGGAIREALRHVNGSSALVMNGDTYVKLDFAAMFSRHLRGESPITMAVTKVDDTARYGGVVVKDQRVVGFVEKGKKGPGWINAGVYVLSRNFPWPQLFASRFSFENDVLTPFLTDLRPTAFPHTGYFLDIGVPEDLDRAQIELA